MSDFTATRAHVYTTGAVIYAAYHNTNENEIYNKHNAAFHASTGHTHTGGTGDGPKIAQSGLDIAAATWTWTGTHTFNNDVTIGTDKKLYFRDTDNYINSSATDHLNIVCNAYDAGTIDHSTSGFLKTYYQTSTTTGKINNYFRNSDASKTWDVEYDYTSGDVCWRLNSASAAFIEVSQSASFVKLYGDVSLQTGGILYFDASSSHTSTLTGDTYMQESAANTLVTYVGGNLYWTLGNASGTLFAQCSQDLMVTSGTELRYDGNASAGDTYTVENSANVLDTYVGGTRHQRFDSGGMELADIDPPAANYIVRKSGIRGYCNFVVTAASSITSNADFNVSSVSCGSYDPVIDWDRNFNSANESIPIGSGTGGGGQLTSLVFSTASGTTTAYAYDSIGQVTSGWYGCVLVAGVQS